MDNTYKLTSEKNDPSLKFFSENPISDWSFAKYETSFNKDKARPVNAVKPTEQNSYVESDLVKLSKQMKDTLNKLVIKGVTQPRICGIHCEGENVHTYVMDLPSPKLYRIINASKIKLFKNVDQMSLLPNVITHLLCLKGVASETATKVETASLYSYSKLKRPAPNPPVSWLSSENVTLSRIPKKQKK